MVNVNARPIKAEVVKSNSSSGNWQVRTSNSWIKFFWDKSEAVAFAEKHNKDNGFTN